MVTSAISNIRNRIYKTGPEDSSIIWRIVHVKGDFSYKGSAIREGDSISDRALGRIEIPDRGEYNLAVFNEFKGKKILVNEAGNPTWHHSPSSIAGSTRANSYPIYVEQYEFEPQRSDIDVTPSRGSGQWSVLSITKVVLLILMLYLLYNLAKVSGALPDWLGGNKI